MSQQYAFPTHTLNVPFAEADDPKHNGMTLRDYFAAKAMQGFCASMTSGRFEDIFLEIQAGGNEAKVAFHLADAMLKERAK
jgi:hypothetical protein